MWWRRRRNETPLTARERRDESISAYLDGELSEAERTEIEALFAEDSGSREVLEDLRLLTSALHSLSEVRAPRSFAVPAPAAGGVRRSGMFRRMELGIRAAAAAAALLFVVALVNQPGAMTVGTFAQDAAVTAEDSAATSLEALRTSEAAEAGASLLASPEPASVASGDEPRDTPAPSNAAPGAGDGEAPAPAPAEGAPKAAGSGPEDAAFGGPVTGTSGSLGASDGVGGVAPALAALAVLLTVLSVLVAQGRAFGGTGRQ